ncbi:alpha-L-fucosidase [bacterium M21]|nr:alpha-L-fucosidase [bacterium M21]
MDEMWGEQVVKLRAEQAERGQLFEQGNYGMLICWGLYSHLANKVDGKTYYGIGEWIKARAMANIPTDKYVEIAKDFNPVKYNAMEIAQLAKDAGMKYVLAMPKHHDGFAMYHSKAHEFNIVDATPFKRDPMKELADACNEIGIGFGFYYSHNQDWTAPGASGGPKADEQGNPATFKDYFEKKCLPQIEELTTKYGPIEVVWFDTPGRIPKEYVQKLVEVVRKNQPNALISGRAGYGLGDYRTLGDMEVPHQNVDGLWESCDTINDSWAYAWYDENWKTPKQILNRLISCVGRGGTYLLDIGPRGDGSLPERKVKILHSTGRWINRYPQVVYAVDSSPWQHALPWGDATVKGNKLFLTVFQWPSTGRLYLPGLKTPIRTAKLLNGDQSQPIQYRKINGWLEFHLPARAPETLASVVELELTAKPEVDSTWGVDPNIETELLVDFATVSGAVAKKQRWMEKFGEWKHVIRAYNWKPNAKAQWEVEVLTPGDYQIDLTYTGKGRVVWGVDVEGGQHIQNQQNSSTVYHRYPIGWLNFPEPGRYQVSVSCLEGDLAAASLKSIHFTPIEY